MMRDHHGMRWWFQRRPEPEILTCSFCGKTADDVDRIVIGPGVHICNECVALCNEVLAGQYVGPGKLS